MWQSMKLLMRLTGQYKEFQTEFIVEDFAVSPAKFRERQMQVSHWRNTCSKLQMPLDDTEKPT